MRKYYSCPGCFGVVKYDEEDKEYRCGICQAVWSVETLEKELKRFNGEDEEKQDDVPALKEVESGLVSGE